VTLEQPPTFFIDDFDAKQIAGRNLDWQLTGTIDRPPARRRTVVRPALRQSPV
jgi:hypothetical protein